MSEIIKGVKISSMCVFYAYCIVDGIVDFDTCPKKLKNDTAYVLVSVGQQDLITDEEIKSSAIARYEEACKNSEE